MKLEDRTVGVPKTHVLIFLLLKTQMGILAICGLD
jgi:hypothetical protein